MPQWTFESSPITCHYAGCAEFLHPLRATVHAHMFSSSSPSTYIASIRGFGCSPYPHAPASDPLVHDDEKSCAVLRCCAVPFVFSCKAPCQASFRPLPLGLKCASSCGCMVLLPLLIITITIIIIIIIIIIITNASSFV